MWNDTVEKAGTWWSPESKTRTAQFNRTHSKSYIKKTSVSNRRNSNGSYVPGWHFLTVKSITDTPVSGDVSVWYYGAARYQGGFTYTGGYQDYGSPFGWDNPTSTFAAMASCGATAYKKLRPDLPDFSLAQSVLEMKDAVLPMKNAIRGFLKREAAVNAARKAAGRSTLSKTGQWWLAIQFGWLPVLSDILKYIQAQKSAQGRLDKLIRDEGKPVRRRRDLPEFSYSDGPYYGQVHYSGPYADGVTPSFVTSGYGKGKASMSITTSTVQKVWCEGMFRWWLPDGPRTVEWHRRLLSRNTSTQLTPGVVYNLIPWTWLLDYFTNVGDFVDNTSQGMTDRLVADWVYVLMERTWKSERVIVQHVNTSEGGGSSAATIKGSLTISSKSRYAGSPFGFGVKESSLSPMQLSILGALGLSRLP